MSDMLKHVIVADLLGELSTRGKPWLNNKFLALLLGVLSHAILDYIDNEYVINWFNYNELKIAIPFLIFQIAFTGMIFLIIRKNTRKKVSKYSHLRKYYIIGAIAPDIIDGVYALINPRAWYTGQLLFPWHIVKPGGPPPMSLHNTILLSTLFILIRYLFYWQWKKA